MTHQFENAIVSVSESPQRERLSNVVAIKREQAPPVALRLADANDWALIKKLNLAALASEPSAFGAQAQERIEWTDAEWQAFTQAGYIQVGTNERGETVAMAGAKQKQGGVWQLHSVYVDPLYRSNADEHKRRLGERLISELIDAVRDMKQATQIDLIVNQEKVTAVKLYERLGFVTTDKLPAQLSADGETHHKFAMTKVLTKEEEALPLAA